MTVTNSTDLATYATSIHDSPTLLPENIASFVTAASLAARLSLRCSSLFVDALFEAAKYGTRLSFGVSRQTITNALTTARRLHTLTYNPETSETVKDPERYIKKVPRRSIHLVFTLSCLFPTKAAVFCGY